MLFCRTFTENVFIQKQQEKLVFQEWLELRNVSHIIPRARSHNFLVLSSNNHKKSHILNGNQQWKQRLKEGSTSLKSRAKNKSAYVVERRDTFIISSWYWVIVSVKSFAARTRLCSSGVMCCFLQSCQMH